MPLLPSPSPPQDCTHMMGRSGFEGVTLNFVTMVLPSVTSYSLSRTGARPLIEVVKDWGVCVCVGAGRNR